MHSTAGGLLPWHQQGKIVKSTCIVVKQLLNCLVVWDIRQNLEGRGWWWVSIWGMYDILERGCDIHIEGANLRSFLLIFQAQHSSPKLLLSIEGTSTSPLCKACQILTYAKLAAQIGTPSTQVSCDNDYSRRCRPIFIPSAHNSFETCPRWSNVATFSIWRNHCCYCSNVLSVYS